MIRKMMEQNSDRLYWIIGAIVVGSILILIAYHFFPTLFSKNVNSLFKNLLDVGSQTQKNNSDTEDAHTKPGE